MLLVKELLVVEGKTDVNRLRSLVGASFYCTNGFYVCAQTISDITRLSQETGVILFLDNDSAGELIRRKLQAGLPSCKNAYIASPWGKLGQVALASDETLLESLGSATFIDKSRTSINWKDFLELDISVSGRKLLCQRLGVSFCNNKQFFKRVNMMGLGPQSLRFLLDENI